ncbi:hypothetical protein [Thermocatellispora tengchongensis]
MNWPRPTSWPRELEIDSHSAYAVGTTPNASSSTKYPATNT